MYKFDKYHQFKLGDFNQPMGLKMNPVQYFLLPIFIDNILLGMGTRENIAEEK